MTAEKKQCLLKYLGYYDGEVDGIWGAGSAQATRDLQEASGISVDGIFGDGTLAAAKDAVAHDRFKKQDRPVEPPAPETGGDFWAEIVGFTRNEFACPCPRCGGFPVEPAERLVRVAVQIREHFGGKPVIVSSGVRCQAHNAELSGSSPTSRHMRGLAMDFAVRGVPVAQVLDYTRQLVSQGVARYTYEMTGTGYVHIDVYE